MSDFFKNNYIYFVILLMFIVLVLIGYIVDKIKTNKLKKELEDEKKNGQLNIPVTDASFPKQNGNNSQSSNDIINTEN